MKLPFVSRAKYDDAKHKAEFFESECKILASRLSVMNVIERKLQEDLGKYLRPRDSSGRFAKNTGTVVSIV